MQAVQKGLSKLTLSQDKATSPKCAPLPAEMVLRIFSYLSEANLDRASRTCKLWHNVSLEPRLWRPILAQTYPEKARFFALHADLSRVNLDWHALAYRSGALLTSQRGTSLAAAHALQMLPDVPQASNVYVDMDGDVYVASRKLELIVTSSLKGKMRFSVVRAIGQQFENAMLHICSVRSTPFGKIAILRLMQNGVSKLIIYNLARPAVWESEPKVDYVSPGGTNLGLGWAVDGEATNWDRTYSQARQQFRSDVLSNYFFTKQPSASDPTKHAYCLYDLKELQEPLLTGDLPAGKEVLYIDCNREGDFFILTTKATNGQLAHIIHQRNPSRIYENYQVLAFDPEHSIAVVKSLNEAHEELPLFLMQKKVVDGAQTLHFEGLPVRHAVRYSAQIKATYVAILTKRTSAPSLWCLPLTPIANLPEEKRVLYRPLPDHTIRSFTLYDDILLLLTNTPSGKLGPLVFCDLKTLLWTWLIDQKITAVLGREAHLFICQTKNGIITLNNRRKTIAKLSDSIATGSYEWGILTTITPPKMGPFGGKQELRSFL